MPVVQCYARARVALRVGERSLTSTTTTTTRRVGRKEPRARGVRVRTQASLLGVGTPEVLVIGVVALLVFGPKGLADAAKGVGKTLRSFQPTIQELKEVSEEFKTTIEDEIGLDEFKNAMQSPPSRPYTKKEEEKEPTIDEMRQASAAAAWGNQGENQESTTPSSEAGGGESDDTFEQTLSAPVDAPKAESEAAPAPAPESDLSKLTLEELQQELERRKKE